MNPDRSTPAYELPSPTLRNWERADVAGSIAPLYGRRLILVSRQGSHHDYRAFGEPRKSSLALVLDAISEEEWMRFRMLAMQPKDILRWPAAAVWVEME